MVIAQYSIRSKQAYIYKTDRIKDIVGASINISMAWDILIEEAEKAGMICRTVSKDRGFNYESIKKSCSEGSLNLVELFRGGGNDTLLLDSKETFIKLNQKFSYRIITEYPGMIPMAVSVEVTGDYRVDYGKLMEESEKKKNTMVQGRDEFVVPFAMVDKKTFQPYSGFYNYGERISDEVRSKRKTGDSVSDSAVKLLDDLVTKHGEESLLAIVHADGNNMGSKIQQMLTGQTDYDYCIEKMRKFTKTTAEVFVDKGLEAMRKRQAELKEKYGEKYKEKSYLFRQIVADGDDMTFICNARFAMEYVKAYVEAVDAYRDDEWKYSSCAGICIFHSHYPFARAYSLAEQCCDDGAKKMVHDAALNGDIKEEAWVDFHYIHSGIGGELTEIRSKQGTQQSMARPWCLCGRPSERSYDKLKRIACILNEEKVARTAIKEVGAKWEDSHEDGRKELNKLCGHKKGLREKLNEVFKDENDLLKAIYDLYEVYDIWFKEV